MDQVVISSVLAVLGLAMGSFAGATVWRLRARQLHEDKADGEKVDHKEYKTLKPLTETTFKSDRSRCLHCGHALKWYDLMPLVSWASTGGRCRYCKKKIGFFEPLIELGMAALFVGSYLLWRPFSLDATVMTTAFFLWLVAIVMLVILLAYDFKWFLLPDRVMFPLIGVSAVYAILQVASAANPLGVTYSLAAAIVILSGLYLLLWLVSKGQWIGFGDVKLGLALALLLVDWQLAFIALFAANVIGLLIVTPGMLMGKITRKTRVPFGPLLVAGMLFAFFVGQPIIGWYMSMLIVL